jgi:hypothetical protein
MKKRNALYLGEKDKDIVEYISPLLKRYDFSSVVRELIRDGIKFRKGANVVVAPPTQNVNVLQSSHSSQAPQLDDIKLEQKELDPNDISDKLDNL